MPSRRALQSEKMSPTWGLGHLPKLSSASPQTKSEGLGPENVGRLRLLGCCKCMYVCAYIYRYTHLHTCTMSSAFIKVCIVWFGAFRFCRHKLWLQSSPWFLYRPIPFLYGLHRVVRVMGLQLSFMIGVRRCSTNSVPFYGGVGFKLLQWILDLRLQR